MAHPKIYFVRHGQTDWNVAYRLQGQQDIPINETGRKQAKSNGKLLKSLIGDPQKYRYIASPLGRTRETMNIIRHELGLPSHGYETDDRLKEIAFGQWETHTFDELRADFPALVEQREENKWEFQPPLGESYARLLNRILSWLPYVKEDSIVVCHGGILRVLEHHFNNTPTDEVVHLTIPQDNIYLWDGQSAQWIK